jgi:hypothetical protein
VILRTMMGDFNRAHHGRDSACFFPVFAMHDAMQ